MKQNERLYVDIHAIQTLPPSCVNRDDTGSPKSAVYGGVTRARVSSQCWKRAMRLMFADIFGQEQLGKRTKRIVGMVEREIAALDPQKDAQKLAIDILKAAGLGIKDADKGTDALFFMSADQARALAKLAVENPELISEKPNKKNKETVQNALNDRPGIDIALFGRMVADDKQLNCDACAQVAHSISTHEVRSEFDYFTAVDDCAPEDNAGAGHIGTVEFNSSTMYRYATVAVHELKKTLGGDTASAVEGFVDAFVRSMPTGKLNTFANRTLPDAVYVTVRRDQPVNLAGAFENPVKAEREGYAAKSVSKLVEKARETYADYVDAPELSLGVGESLGGLAKIMSFKQLKEELKAYLDGAIGEEQ